MNTQDVIGLALVYAIIAASLIIALVLDRRGSKTDVRKVVHMGVGFFVFVWWMFSENWIMLVFFAIPFGAILFVAMFKGNAVSDSKLGDLSNNKGHRTGLFLYVLTIGILIAFFWDHWTAATIGVVAMTFGVMAAVIVTFYGWLTASGFYPTGDSVATVPLWVVCITAGVLASVLEALCPGQYDNIVTPLVVASAMVLLGL